jgi:menaquinone-dependent protoporphyrinogen oxidase
MASATRVLVAYGSKFGSTAEIAEAIAGELRAQGLEVDCVAAGDAKTADGYDGVVLGSAVYMKRWRREARRFLEKHADELERIPFWVFSSGPVGEIDQREPDWEEPAKVIALAERLGVREHVVFGGSVPAEPKGLIQKAMANETPEEFRDLRDWDEIRAWAAGIAGALQRAAA